MEKIPTFKLQHWMLLLFIYTFFPLNPSFSIQFTSSDTYYTAQRFLLFYFCIFSSFYSPYLSLFFTILNSMPNARAIRILIGIWIDFKVYQANSDDSKSHYDFSFAAILWFSACNRMFMFMFMCVMCNVYVQ